MTRTRLAVVPKEIFAALPYADDAIHPGEQAGILKRLDRLGDGRAGAAGALGDRGVGREAKAAAGVMKAPQQRLKDGQGLGGDRAVSLALLGPAHHGAGKGHDPRLGVTVEWTWPAVAENLLAAGA